MLRSNPGPAAAPPCPTETVNSSPGCTAPVPDVKPPAPAGYCGRRALAPPPPAPHSSTRMLVTRPGTMNHWSVPVKEYRWQDWYGGAGAHPAGERTAPAAGPALTPDPAPADTVPADTVPADTVLAAAKPSTAALANRRRTLLTGTPPLKP